MISSRRPRNRSPSISNHHRAVSQIKNSGPTVNSNNDDCVRSWLHQVHKAQGYDATRAPGSDDEANDGDKSQHHKSSWYPNNLPVGCVVLSERAGPRQQVRFPDDVLIMTSPAASREWYTSSPRSHRSLEIRGTKCNRSKRRRSSPCDTQRSLTDGPLFEKKPRRRTRPSRYETRKKQHHVKEKSKRKEKKPRSRASKYGLRSSRDVVDNFTSETLSNKKLTMKPSLTAGLFFNGRSSTKTRQLTDLVFNDMSFLKFQQGAKYHKKDGSVNHETNDDSFKEFDRDEGFAFGSRGHQDQASEIGRFSPMTNHTSTPTLPPMALAHQPRDRGEQSTSREVERNQSNEQSGHHSNKLDETQPNRGVTSPDSGCGVSRDQNEAPLGPICPGTIFQAQTSASITPGLAGVGVYDETGALRKESRTPQASKEPQCGNEPENLGRNSQKMTPYSHTSGYKDQGVMVTPRLHQKTGSSSETLCQKNQQGEHKDTIRKTEAPGNGTIQLCTESIPPMRPQESFWASAGIGLNTEQSSMEVLGAQCEGQKRLDIFNLNLNGCHAGPYQNSRTISALDLSLEDTESIRAEPLARSAHAHSFSQLEDYEVERPYYGVLSYEEPLPFERPINGHSPMHYHHPSYAVDTEDPSLLHSQLLPNLSSGRTESIEAVNQAMPRDNSNFQFHAQGSINETMKDFIDRIEAEASIKWDEAQYLEDDIDYDRIDDYQIDGERYHTEENSEGFHMASFWKPNPFI